MRVEQNINSSFGRPRTGTARSTAAGKILIYEKSINNGSRKYYRHHCQKIRRRRMTRWEDSRDKVKWPSLRFRETFRLSHTDSRAIDSGMLSLWMSGRLQRSRRKIKRIYDIFLSASYPRCPCLIPKPTEPKTIPSPVTNCLR
jgi:hypothetical protein